MAAYDTTARLWDVFSATQTLVDHAKRSAPRCLTDDQRAWFYLPEEPPRWCMTGPDRERETDPTKWQPKWPYHTTAWRDWLAAKDRGDKVTLPTK